MTRRVLTITIPVSICMTVVAALWCAYWVHTGRVLTELNGVAERYSIVITTRDEPFPIATVHGAIAGEDASRWQLASYASLLALELSVYPRDFFRRTKLRRIVLCRGLAFRGERRGAIPDYEHNALYFDVRRGAYDREYQRRGFHHELFHIVDFRDDGIVYRDKEWRDLNASTFMYGGGGVEFGRQHRFAPLYDQIPGFLNAYSASGVEEDKAEVFAALPGSPFPTGGSGSFITLLDSATICRVRQHLFVTNSASNDVTSFVITADGSPMPAPGSPFPTGGSSPVPVVETPNGEFLYVGNFGSNTITIFSINVDGSLSSVFGPVMTLPRGPISLTINHVGTLLFVTFNSPPGPVQVFEIAGDGGLSAIDVFSVGSSSSVGSSINSTDTRLFIPDFGNTGIYVYAVSGTGDLSQIPGSPFPNTGAFSPADTQISTDDQFLYVANRSGAVTGFLIDSGGALSALSGSPFLTGGSTPEVLALSATQPFLFVVNSNSRTITTFAVGPDGTPSATRIAEIDPYQTRPLPRVRLPHRRVIGV